MINVLIRDSYISTIPVEYICISVFSIIVFTDVKTFRLVIASWQCITFMNVSFIKLERKVFYLSYR